MILRKDELIFRMSRVGGRGRGREEGNGWIGSGAVFHEPFAGMINALPTPIPLPSLLSSRCNMCNFIPQERFLRISLIFSSA